jgi:hypothetical protein
METITLADTRILTVDRDGAELVIRIPGVPDMRVDADITDTRLARVLTECIRRAGTTRNP